MNKYQEAIWLSFFVVLLTGCPPKAEPVVIRTNEGQLNCGLGFTEDESASECSCDPPNIQFGQVNCLETIPRDFSFAAMDDCPGAMAVKLTDDYKHSVERDGLDFGRYEMNHFGAYNNGNEPSILVDSYLSSRLPNGNDSIIFLIPTGTYFELDDMDRAQNYLFHGIRTDSTTLEGTMSWGPWEDYWRISQVNGSCQASFKLLDR